jgi:hypothetical protein
MYVYCCINPATALLMRYNGGIDKLHTLHAILNGRKLQSQRVSGNAIPAGENGIGNIGIQVGECL